MYTELKENLSYTKDRWMNNVRNIYKRERVIRLREDMREIVKQMLYNAQAEVCRKYKNQNKEYQQAVKEIQLLMKRINERLGTDAGLLDAWEDLTIQLHGFQTEQLYYQGIFDCMASCKRMGAFSEE